MTRIASRLDASNQILSQYMTFSKKAIDEITRLRQNNQPNRDSFVEDEEAITEEELMFEGTDLLKLGGNTFREQAINIANRLWNEDERMKYCVEPKKQLDPQKGRVPADALRAGLLRRAMQHHMKDNFNSERYHGILKHVNQHGVDLTKRKRRSEQKENVMVDANTEDIQSENQNQ